MNGIFMDMILQDHLRRYPRMQAADLYKLVHQAALGSEHAVRDEQAVRSWLERELAEMGDGPNDPQMDPLSPDGQILRVHLRPYLRAGKNPERLLQAFIQTANEWRGSFPRAGTGTTTEKLKEYGAAARRLAQAGTGSIRGEEIEAFLDKMEEQDFPAVHHSEIYERLYRPAYRVIARQFLEEK
jgi:hypothetical protein